MKTHLTKKPAKRAATSGAAAPATAAPAAPYQHDPRVPPVGTVMRRKYKGRVREIKVLADGFDYKGEHYDTLSRVWCHIKGVTNTNGYVDQGLVQRIGGQVRDPASVAKEYGPAALDFNAIAEELGLHAIPPSLDKLLEHATPTDVKRLGTAAERMQKAAQALRHTERLLAARVGQLPVKASA